VVAAARRGKPVVVVIGCSTGGPEALTRIMPLLPSTLEAPVLVVQHMTADLTGMFARRLNQVSSLEVVEAEDGDDVVPGQVLVAPGGRHLELRREQGELVARLTTGLPENYVRPAADVLFRTAVKACGAGVLACVLTGIGRDGADGAAAVRAAGGEVLAQDKETSRAWGMPGSVVREGNANRVAPLDGIARELVQMIAQRTGVARSG